MKLVARIAQASISVAILSVGPAISSSLYNPVSDQINFADDGDDSTYLGQYRHYTYGPKSWEYWSVQNDCKIKIATDPANRYPYRGSMPPEKGVRGNSMPHWKWHGLWPRDHFGVPHDWADKKPLFAKIRKWNNLSVEEKIAKASPGDRRRLRACLNDINTEIAKRERQQTEKDNYWSKREDECKAQGKTLRRVVLGVRYDQTKSLCLSDYEYAQLRMKSQQIHQDDFQRRIERRAIEDAQRENNFLDALGSMEEKFDDYFEKTRKPRTINCTGSGTTTYNSWGTSSTDLKTECR